MVASANMATSHVSAAEPTAAAPVAGPTDVRDVVLMLERGPLHLRMNIQIDGVSLAAARRAYLGTLMTKLDVDRDGRLTRAEADRCPLLRPAGPAPNAEFLESLGVDESTVDVNLELAIGRVAGEAVVYREEDSASQSDARVFELLDDNGSGVVEADEMSSAAAPLIRLDDDRDQCVGYDEVQPPPVEPPPSPAGAVAAVTAEPPARATFSELVRDMRDPLLARRMLRKYDRDASGQLSGEELKWSDEQLASIDHNRDGALSVSELRELALAPVDLALRVDLGSAMSRPSLTVLAGDRRRIESAAVGGQVHVTFDDASVTLSCRDLDPIPAAIDAARRRFNQLDVDGNGYLDAPEAEPDVRLRRVLFAAMDANADGKVFGDEVTDYVRLWGEPVATTCRVNVYDTGSGFFQTLDRNNDGRISQRELRTSEPALRELDRDDRPGVTLEEPAPRFSHRVCARRFSIVRANAVACRLIASIRTRFRRRADLVSTNGPQQRRRSELAGVSRPPRRFLPHRRGPRRAYRFSGSRTRNCRVRRPALSLSSRQP